jgi:hypothetical protein
MCFRMPVGQQVQTSMGQVIAIVVGAVVFLAAVATVLDWLGFVPNGPHIISRIRARVGSLWARVQARRARRKAVEQRMEEPPPRIDPLMSDLERVLQLHGPTNPQVMNKQRTGPESFLYTVTADDWAVPLEGATDNVRYFQVVVDPVSGVSIAEISPRPPFA